MDYESLTMSQKLIQGMKELTLSLENNYRGNMKFEIGEKVIILEDCDVYLGEILSDTMQHVGFGDELTLSVAVEFGEFDIDVRDIYKMEDVDVVIDRLKLRMSEAEETYIITKSLALQSIKTLMDIKKGDADT